MNQEYTNHRQFYYVWLAGFIDGDGCINSQIVFRPDYILKYQIRVSITAFQSTTRHFILLEMKK
jgi:hypothetical protein